MQGATCDSLGCTATRQRLHVARGPHLPSAQHNVQKGEPEVQPTCRCFPATCAAPNIMNFKFGREVSRGMGGRKGGHKFTQHAGWTACGGDPRGRNSGVTPAVHASVCSAAAGAPCSMSHAVLLPVPADPPSAAVLPAAHAQQIVGVYAIKPKQAVEPNKAPPCTPCPAGARRAAPPVLHRAAGPLRQHGEGWRLRFVNL